MKLIKIIKEISTYFSHSHFFHNQNSFLSNLQSVLFIILYVIKLMIFNMILNSICHSSTKFFNILRYLISCISYFKNIVMPSTYERKNISNSVEVNPNPQFDGSLTSEYSDMSSDKESSENLLNDVVNESTNSISTEAINFHQNISSRGKADRRRIHYYRKLFVSELSVYLNQNNYLVSKNRAEQKWGYRALEKAILTASQMYIRMKELKQVIRGQDLLSGLYLILQIEEENKLLVKKEKYLYVKLHLLMKHTIFCRLGQNINSLMTAAKTIILNFTELIPQV
ncbi:hypothetical protein Avbf_05431 [Armadillidium vulgare]|nr:hypothetical protein Avbf_05431 [Armadillidium vulgare]